MAYTPFPWLLEYLSLSYVAAAILLYYFIVVSYRLTLHPLAGFPGPKLAASSLLYEYYYDGICWGRFWVKLQELHEQYGPIVRINPNELHINDPEYYTALYGYADLAKDPRMHRSLGLDFDLEGTLDWMVHKRRRAPFAGFFTKTRIRQVEGLIRDSLEKLSSTIVQHKDSSLPVNLHLLLQCFTAEVVCEYCFAKQHGFFEDIPKAKTFFNSRRPANYPGIHFPGRWTKYVKFLIKLDARFQYLLKKLDRTGKSEGNNFVVFMRWARTCAEEVIARHDKADESAISTPSREHPTIFDSILEGDLPPAEKSLPNLTDNALLFLGAGAGTTAYGLTMATFLILTHPDVKDRLRQELKSASCFPDPTQIPDWASLEQLPFLTGVVKETLRLDHGVMSRLNRINYKSSMQYRQYTIPAGTPVGMSHCDLHLNPDSFPDPHHFDPDRWVRCSPEEAKRMGSMLNPFSRGSRQCIAVNLAMAELYICLATLFRRFDLELCVDGDERTTADDVMPYYDNFVPVPKNGKTKLFVNVN